MNRQIACLSVLVTLGVARVATTGQVTAAVPRDHVGHVADEGPPLTLKAALDEAVARNLDFQAVMDNQRTLLDAQLGYVRALSEFELATADLELAVGADLPEGTTVSATNQAPSPPRDRSVGAVGVLGGLDHGGVR